MATLADSRSGHREVGDAQGARAGRPSGEQGGRRATAKPKTTLERRAEDAALAAARVRGQRACRGGRVRLGQSRDVLDKIDEEVAELRREVESGATGDLSRAEEEMGDLLFAIANLSRKLGIEPEAALRRANEKFTSRFDAVEQAFAARKQSMSDATLEEMEAEWQRVKSAFVATFTGL